MVMAAVTPTSPQPHPESFDRGFKVGCLIGCSPLILLGLVFVLMCAGAGFHQSPVGTGARPDVQLPRFDVDTPAAALLPVPPERTEASVYVGLDLSQVPELTL